MKRNKSTLYLGVTLLLILFIRLLFVVLLPYIDTTEARYGEIARLMLETHQWVMPQFDYGVPFWGKPPMFAWISAFGYYLFGVNEFGGRFPSFIISLITIVLVGKWALKFNRLEFFFFAFVLLITPVFLLHTGVVSTDTTLNLSIVLVMISFWKAMLSPEKSIWGYLFFVGFGLGFLAKGPIVLVLTVPPMLIWVVQQKKWKNLWQYFPWLVGVPLVILIALPWYWAAEKTSPGFIDYFIIGEHFKRFVDSGWKGDKYGNAHVKPFGMIWVFFITYLFPWLGYVFYKCWNYGKRILDDSWAFFLLCWMFWLPCFFLLSNNYLPTYVLPCAVPSALLIVHWMPLKTKYRWVKITSIIPGLMLVATIGYIFFFASIKKIMTTDKYLVEHYTEYKKEHPDEPVEYLYYQYRSFSSRFYTKGKSLGLRNKGDFDEYYKLGKPFFLVLPKQDAARYYTKPLDPYRKYFKYVDSNRERNLYLVTPPILVK